MSRSTRADRLLLLRMIVWLLRWMMRSYCCCRTLGCKATPWSFPFLCAFANKAFFVTALVPATPPSHRSSASLPSPLSSHLHELPDPTMSSPQLYQQEEERIEALVAARLEQRLTAQLRDVGKVLLAATRAGCSVLQSAASMGRHELLREILHVFETSADDGSAPPDIRSDLRAATLVAAIKGHTQCLQLLLGSCTSSPSSLAELLDAKDVRAWTPLMNSAMKGHVECMRLLLEHGPETQVAASDKFGWTALMHAANYGHAACIQLLLAHSPDIQVAAVSHKGATALMHAAAKGHTACMQLLLAHSPHIQVAAADPHGISTLMVAAERGHPSSMQLLLAHSPDVQMAALSAGGRSALCSTIAKAQVECLQLLLAHSPSQQQLDQALGEAGQKMSQLQPPPADEQLRLGLKKIIGLLLSNGAMPTAQASEGAVAAIRPIIKELTARALVPDMANEAVLGLALAATARKRQASGGDAAGPSQRARTSP